MLQCHNISVVSDLIILKECSQLPENAMVVYWDDIQAVRSQNEKADGLEIVAEWQVRDLFSLALLTFECVNEGRMMKWQDSHDQRETASSGFGWSTE